MANADDALGKVASLCDVITNRLLLLENSPPAPPATIPLYGDYDDPQSVEDFFDHLGVYKAVVGE